MVNRTTEEQPAANVQPSPETISIVAKILAKKAQKLAEQRALEAATKQQNAKDDPTSATP